MYGNIGGKLMVMAKVLFGIGLVGSVISGLAVITISVVSGIIVIVIGGLASWISTLTMYGLGYLIVLSESMYGDMKYGKIAAETSTPTNTIFSNSRKMGAAKTCPHCGEQVTSDVCGMCGQKNNLYD